VNEKLEKRRGGQEFHGGARNFDTRLFRAILDSDRQAGTAGRHSPLQITGAMEIATASKKRNQEQRPRATRVEKRGRSGSSEGLTRGGPVPDKSMPSGSGKRAASELQRPSTGKAS
jgi:hypothetical protein